MIRRRIAAVLLSAGLLVGVAGCDFPWDEGTYAGDSYDNRIDNCEPSAAPTAAVTEETTVTIQCRVRPPKTSPSPSPVVEYSPSPSPVVTVSPSPVVSVSPSPVPVPVEEPDIWGGYYLASNANMSADFAAIGNNEMFTQYRAIGDWANGHNLVFPGYGPLFDYLTPLVNGGMVGNFVVENTCFKASDCAAKTVTVEGKTYSVPAGNAKRNWSPTAASCHGGSVQDYLGFDQFTSGQMDGLLHAALAQTRNFTGPLIWHIYSEIDTDVECGYPQGGVNYTRAQANAKAAAAAVYMMDWLRDPCSFEPAPCSIQPIGSNVKFTVGMGGFHAASYNEVYTEAVRDRVDYYNFNTYWRSASSNWVTELNVDLGNVRKPGWPVKDVIVTEYGTPNAAAAGVWSNTQADRVEQFPKAVWDVNHACENCSKIRGAAYFNSNAGWAQFADKPAGLKALSRAYGDTMFSRQGE